MTPEANLLHELPWRSADRAPQATALLDDDRAISYAALAEEMRAFAAALAALGLQRGERVGIYLDKRRETVVASFGAPAQGGVFVPINPLLKAEQVAYILRDCGVRVLVTSPERLRALQAVLPDCPSLAHVIVTGAPPATVAGPAVHAWAEVLQSPPAASHRVVDTDMVGILYTSGSTGKPKGVVLSHRNMVAGAKSVATYLENRSDDVLLAALPLSFDAGFSQLTTAFHAGASVVLLNYLLPRDVVKAVVAHRVTGMTAVPPLWIQLTQVKWPDVGVHFRYFANTGGRMPLDTLKSLRALLPSARPFLMYGLTEAFRATYLPPDQVDRRPDSIGKAIPNSEVLVLRPDGTPCDPGEPGELVQRGALVAQGYWNDPEKTAERFRPLPGREPGLVLPEIAVFSGDTVRRDEEGYLYFIGRRDEMIKSSGYRISPNEVEEVLYATQRVGECAAFGVPHATLGEAVIVVATARAGAAVDAAELLALCRERLPAYMVPAQIELREGPLPRNANGKIDRKAISTAFRDALQGVAP
ncbi:MAG: acyl-CoA ligase (AMP-forming), exosortase A system-associated [Piscinibacter sp.]|nr:acyl-CoA ligase (AMP-forming), exosortase A system-associated [Piscinibacter sp.]